MPTDGHEPAGIVTPRAASAAYTSISCEPAPIVAVRFWVLTLMPRRLRRSTTIPPDSVE
jgi:hypothetical protein